MRAAAKVLISAIVAISLCLVALQTPYAQNYGLTVNRIEDGGARMRQLTESA